MHFCGQCGLKLAPGDTTCPRCGSVTEPELVLDPQLLDPHLLNEPTIASAPHVIPKQRPIGSPTPPQQQKLVLHPDGRTPGLGAYAPNEPTSMMSAQASALPPNPDASVRTPYHGFIPPVDIGYQPAIGQFGSMDPLPPQRPPRRDKGQTTVLLIVLFVLLFVVGGVVVFVVKTDVLKGLIGNPALVPTTPATPSALARAVIQQYYDDINKRNYLDAYNLWEVDPQHPAAPYDQFVNGFAHTKHDDVIFNSITPLPDGTVQLDVTLHATEETSSGTVITPYHLFYLVGQRNGTWKILKGRSIS